MKWQYDYIWTFHGVPELIEMLNKKGKRGWELVTCEYSENYCNAILKRQVKEEV